MPDLITDLDDPRLLPFRKLKGSDTPQRMGLFIVEGDKLVERLLESPIEAVTVLVSDRLAERYASICPANVTVLVGSDALLCEIVGFKFHRGVLACGRRPLVCSPNDEQHDPVAALQSLAEGEVLIACPQLHDLENMGLIIRTAAGLGADGLLVSDTGVDVFARRCVRVSMGAAFTLPIVQVSDIRSALRSLQTEHGFQLIATTLADGAVNADTFHPAKRFALLMGSEPYGLPAEIEAMADARLTMTMHRSIDSHNVAVAAGMLLSDLMRKRTHC